MSSKEERDADILIDTKVRTTKSNSDDWAEEAKLIRRWGVTGTICDLSNSHGLIYKIKHEDGSYAWYEPTEFESIDEDKSKLVNCSNCLHIRRI